MEPESSLPYSQALATCPYPEPTPSSPHHPFPLPENPSTSWSPQWSLSLRFPHQNLVLFILQYRNVADLCNKAEK